MKATTVASFDFSPFRYSVPSFAIVSASVVLVCSVPDAALGRSTLMPPFAM